MTPGGEFWGKCRCCPNHRPPQEAVIRKLVYIEPLIMRELHTGFCFRVCPQRLILSVTRQLAS